VNLLVLGGRAQAKLGLARGDLSTAQEALYKLEALVEQERFADHARWVVDIRLHVWLAEAKLAEASEWAAQTMLFLDARGPVRREELLLLVRVSLAQQQYAQAARMLERWRRHLDQPGDIGTTIEWMALSVVALHQSGKRAQAMRVAARLLRLSEPEGYIRVYLDAGEPMKQVVQTLLAQVSFGSKGAARNQKGQARGVSISRSFLTVMLSAFKHEEEKHASRASTPLASRQTLQSEPAPATLPLQHAEPLSPQELRVLRLLVAGQSYAEMAEMLVVSINTIKTQVSSIYRKLGVNRRLEAIAATRRLHLLSPDPPQTPS
jgi:LuxR family maltose regulon positive regulatory protein